MRICDRHVRRIGRCPTSDDWARVRQANIERPFGDYRLVTATTIAGGRRRLGEFFAPRQEFVYFGGPVSAPGYDYHSLVRDAGVSRARRVADAERRSFRSRSAASAACQRAGRSRRSSSVVANTFRVCATPFRRDHCHRAARIAPRATLASIRRRRCVSSARSTSCASRSRADSRGRAVDVQHRSEPRVLDDPLSGRRSFDSTSAGRLMNSRPRSFGQSCSLGRRCSRRDRSCCVLKHRAYRLNDHVRASWHVCA